MNLLRVATINLQDGLHLDGLPGLLEPLGQLDVLTFQEGKGYEREGGRLRYRAEGLLRPLGLDRSFLTLSPYGTLHTLVFVRSDRLRPLQHFIADPPYGEHDKNGWVCLAVEGLEPPLLVRSDQWMYCDGEQRLSAAHKLTRYARPGVASLIGADLNALWPDCPGHVEHEPDWSLRPAHTRFNKTLPPGLAPAGPDGQTLLVSDRRATTVLAAAGFVSAGCLAGDMTPTVNTPEAVAERIDHLVLSPSLACAYVPGSYQVCAGAPESLISDHRVVACTLDLDRYGRPAPAERALLGARA